MDLYGEAYYRHHCGPVPLERNAAWLGRAGAIADHIVRSLKPRRVFDAGCAMGLLVESLWDKGVEASGIDVSSYTMSKVRPDLQKQCTLASISDPHPRAFRSGHLHGSAGASRGERCHEAPSRIWPPSRTPFCFPRILMILRSPHTSMSGRSSIGCKCLRRGSLPSRPDL